MTPFPKVRAGKEQGVELLWRSNDARHMANRNVAISVRTLIGEFCEDAQQALQSKTDADLAAHVKQARGKDFTFQN